MEGEDHRHAQGSMVLSQLTMQRNTGFMGDERTLGLRVLGYVLGSSSIAGCNFL